MGRFIRNTAILAKIESTYGTDATPTEGANAILISNASITPLQAQNVKRDLIRPYMGNSEELLGAAYVEMTFDVELAGSGAAGTGFVVTGGGAVGRTLSPPHAARNTEPSSRAGIRRRAGRMEGEGSGTGAQDSAPRCNRGQQQHSLRWTHRHRSGAAHCRVRRPRRA